MVADAGLLAVELLLVAFAGGVFGAAIGALPSFSLAGVAIAASELAEVASANSTPTDSYTAPILPPDAGAVGVTELVGLGPGFGPHVAFAGGVAAAAYAGRKDYIDFDTEYHRAKEITEPLGTAPDVLLVGGVFGVLGYLFTQLSVQFALPVDPIAASIVLSAFLHRLVFGYPLLGKFEAGLLDMTPYERGDRRTTPDDGDDDSPAVARYVVEPWLPYQSEWPNVAVLGLAVGLFSAFLAVATGSFFLAFGITAGSLLFLSLGLDRFPVTHHMALPASFVALAVPEPWPVAGAIVIGGLFGLLGGLLAELAQRLLYAHADTHIDPPAASIVCTSVLIALLEIAGFLAGTPIPTLGL